MDDENRPEAETETAPKHPGLGFGLIFVAVGIGIYLLVRADPSGANAPAFVIDAAAGAFFFAGISIVGQALSQPLVSRMAGLGVVYLLAVPGLWMLLGDDQGQCSVSIAIGGMGTSGAGSADMCRMVFGAGGVLVLGFAVLMTVLSFSRPKD